MNVNDLLTESINLFEKNKFDEAIEKLHQVLDGIEDKNSQIQPQIYAQSFLGNCYFEQAKKAKGIEATERFELAIKCYKQWLILAEQIEDKQNSLQEQIYAQFGLGSCYSEQAKEAKGMVAVKFFEQEIACYTQWLILAEQIEDKQNSLQQQIYALSGLGRGYLEQAKKAKGATSVGLFQKAVTYDKKWLMLTEQIEDEQIEGEQNKFQQQIYALSGLSYCYVEQAMKAKGTAAVEMFNLAIKNYTQYLEFAGQLKDEQKRIQQQINSRFWLGHCFLKWAIKIKNEDAFQAKELSKKAAEYFSFSMDYLQGLQDELERNRVEKIIHRYLSASCCFLQEEWERYFEQKKLVIQEELFPKKSGDLIDAISTILAVLNITPIELSLTPLAHYTSPFVCEKLFGISNDQEANLMRMGSSTYMNDPTEGEGLLELLNLQDLELENKADCPDYNAFFTCFSSRVNDLNQFRLYGKENSVEASGCCLVFNKEGNWLKESDVSVSFRSMVRKGGEGYSGEQLVEADILDSDFEDDNLPLYQVAYIAYYDEYIAKEKCIIWLPNEENPKFGIRLKPVGKNPDWHEFRIGKLKKALEDLRKESNNIGNEDRKALEYIRYLFKDFAFRDEEEFRLLKIEQIGSDKIEYCETTKSVYLPYADIRDIVDEVILGTNYEKSGNHRKAEAFQHLMRKHYPNVKVSRSSLPINANPPIKKD